MKKPGIKKFLLVLASAVIIAGCSNSLDERSDSSENPSAVGSVFVNDGDSRAIFVDDIVSAVATVTGTGIKNGSEPTGKSDVSAGKGTLSVSGIPAGKNRIITVQAYNSDGKINGVTMRAICDVKAGENTSVSVNWASTALGNVFAELHSLGKDLSSVNIAKIKAAVPADVSSPFVNAKKIASDYVSDSLKASSEYKLSASTVTLTAKNISGYKVYAGDPFSEVQTISSESSESTFQVAPGTWPIYAVDSTGAVKAFGYGTFTDGGKHTINITNNGSVKIVVDGTVIEDRIIVHAKGYSHIWAWWESDGENNNYTGGEWPGKEMTAEVNSWYSTEIKTAKCNVILSNNGKGQTSEKGDELTAGEWWYKDGEWYEGNPEDSVAPIVISFKSSASGTVSGPVVLTAEVTDNSALKKVVFYIGSKEIGSQDVAGTSATATYEWNTAYVKNGTYNVRAVAYDAANNASEEKSISVTTKNENLPPVAVISGSSYAKTESTKEFDAGLSYDQNEGTIKSYSWSVSGGAAILSGGGTSKITVKMPSVEGEVMVSLSVADDEGASSETVSRTVKVRGQSQTSGDFRDETIYFLMTTRFYDGDKSNNRYCWDDESCFNSETLGDPGWRGDFKGLIEKLDYIKALGFTAIWITPVVENASGLDYHGYHAFDFSRVDPRYESSGATYQDLIDAAHAKGIKIIQDIVLNHTGNFGERNLLPIMKKNYSEDDGLHSVSASPDHDSKDIYGNSAYAKLSAGAKIQGFNTYEDIEKSSLDSDKKGGALYQARLMTMKDDSIDTDDPGRLYHHYGVFQWESYYVQEGQMAGDCVDLNTENPVVAKYLRDCYINYINMGVDAFRIDTMKHISRLTMNKEFIPQFKEAGGEGFFIFGEGCVLRNEVWNAGMPGISVPFYTWNANKNKTDASYSWETLPSGAAKNLLMAKTHFEDNTEGIQLTSNNAFLDGNNYHAPDYSKASGLQMIDFFMHHGFENAGAAFGIANKEDQYFNDATYNVTYVDSHDYGPNSGGYLYTRYGGGTAAWAGNFNLMFTFRGIPCVYYGSEIEFQKNKQIEPYTNGNKAPYAESGRAYYGDHLEGSISADDVGVYTASGEIETTLNSDLSQHLMRLNQIRRAIPALRKGQYSTEGCKGESVAFKRRYTDSNTDSFAAVAINGGATFTGLPAGEYIEVVTGKTINSNGTIRTDSIGEGNMRIYVLKTPSCEIDGKIGKDGAYLK